ncbi:Integrase [Fulvivirga imtechensis AK7]|uniref:Integrase n=1 Tax=Fulvivirga imtechensis AK7 TaxID=1237149 RepID=L8JHR6_9BACT|nr:grasp-with-spasm system ATP-grasp peptide maturase [Fulvivirga imtechensis]ELR68406.1 Integrase [Fulvivirga imtechensis AK7]
MILIISQSLEATTDRIIDWINYYKIPFKRLNGIDVYRNISVKIDAYEKSIKIKGLDLTKVKVVWFRRWFGFEDRSEVYFDQSLSKINSLKLQLTKFTQSELKSVTDFFLKFLSDFNAFDTLDVRELNKIEVLLKARELGISVPPTYISTKKSEVGDICRSAQLITKAISNGPSIEHKSEHYFGYTRLIDFKNDKSIPQSFLPSLFQQNIEKKFEIRTFYLEGNFYSMAIFSQKDQQTSIDFRVYNKKYPNRRVPFQLPKQLESKLETLARHFKLSTCSFDIIKTVNNDYVLLEINSGGQFGMVSLPCNFFIEREIAKTLISKHNQV